MEIKNIDRLVDKVAANILDKLDLKTTYGNINHKSCFILIPNMGLGMKEYIEYIIEHYQGYELYLASRENGANVGDFKNIKTLEFDMKNQKFIHLLDSVENIIVLGLKINQMKSIIKTDDEDDVNQLILEGLLANKQVNVMMNANEHIFSKLKNIVTDLRHMGVYVTNIHQVKASSIVSNVEIEKTHHLNSQQEPDRSWAIATKIAPEKLYTASSKLEKECQLNPFKESNDVLIPSKNELITESYVLKLKGRGVRTMILDKKHLITPLAKDKLREYKIDIKYIEEAKS